MPVRFPIDIEAGQTFDLLLAFPGRDMTGSAVNVNGWIDYADNTGGSLGVYAPSMVSRSKGLVSGTLDTTIGNAVDLVYRGNDTNSDSFSCTHFILQQF